jgi:signal transduction histidine kinase
MPSAIDEIERRQAYIKDVIGSGAAMGSSSADDTQNALDTVFDVLISELRLDFACARVNGPSGPWIDVIRLPQRCGLDEAQRDVRQAFSRCLDADGHRWPFVVPNPLGAGHISIAVALLGAHEKMGLVIAGSSRANFPTRTERKVLESAADELAARLQGFCAAMQERAVAEELPPAALERSMIPAAEETMRTAASLSLSASELAAPIVRDEDASMPWLASEPADVCEANAALEQIVRGTAHPNEVISRIQTFVARRETRKVPIDLTHVFAEVLSIMRGAADAQGVSFRVESAVGLPAVIANPVQLQQVMINLVANGLEAMLDVNPRRRVLAVHAKKHGTDAVLVRIRDSGKGLDPQQRQRIFEPFYTTKSEGMGMGLTVSRTIVEAHGGRLWASANDEFGETFQFTLPIAETAAKEVNQPGLMGSA